jgi:hypothetical protein
MEIPTMQTLAEKYAEAPLTGILKINNLWLAHQDSEELVELPPVPSGVTTVLLTGLPHLRSLSQLPMGVQLVYISDCGEFEFDPLSDILPPTVEALCLHNTPNVRSLPLLPDSLQRISCGRTGLEALPPLPPGLVRLYMGYSPLEVIPALPDTVTSVEIIYCRQLATIESFGTSLRDAKIMYNPILLNFPALPPTYLGGSIDAPGYAPAAIIG